MALETQTFFDIAQKNDLISESNLEQLRNGIKTDTLSEIDFDALVSKKVLTSWQAKRLLSGKGNFKVGRYRLLDFIGKDEFGEVYLVKGDSKSYLRLVSKELCDDDKRREQYLARVNAFQKLDLSRLPKITDVAKIGERFIVVSELANGISIAKRCKGKAQSEKLVKQLAAKITQMMIALEASNLKHGSINEHSVIIKEDQKVVVHLPDDVSFSFANQTNSSKQKTSDVRSLAALACGMLAGDFEKPVADGALFKQFAEIAADTNESDTRKSLKKLQAMLGAKASGTPGTNDDDSVLESVPAIQNLDHVSVDSAIPSGHVDGLETMSAPKTDMFGDLGDLSIESAIQAQPQKIKSKIVESDSEHVKDDPSTEPKEPNSSETKPQPNSLKPIVLAALGGAVGALSIGWIVYYVFFSGKDNGSKVAEAKTTISREKVTDQPAKQDSSKNKKDSSSPKRMKKKLPTTSSGMFADVGALNKNANEEASNLNSDNSTAEKDSPNPQNDTGGKETGDKDTGDDLQSDDKPEAPSENSEMDDDMTKKEVDPTKPPATNSDAKVVEEKPNEDKAVGDKENNDTKSETKDAGPVILIGKSPKKDKGDSKPTDGVNIDALFANAPRAVTLPESDSIDTLQLFDIAIPPSLPLTVTLHGGDKATRGKFEFLMKTSTSENSTWLVSMKSKNSVSDPIAKFRLKGQSFEFHWTDAALSQSNAKFLMNCGLKISTRQTDHKLALREPVESSLLNYERTFSPTAEAKLSDLPDVENIKIQLVNFSDNFPDRSFVDKTTEIVGRTGSITIVCNPENIDIFKTRFTSRNRGSKMLVNGESYYVTPDKREIKISSFAKFESEANRNIASFTKLQINYAELMERYNKIKDANQKRQFTSETNRAEIEKQVNAGKPLKAHLERALAILKSVNESQIGVRIFYQAGELEVDLATPDGKPYTPPKPAEEEKKK